MMLFNSKTLGVVGGLLAGLVLGTVLTAVFSASPPARASAAPKPEESNKALAAEQLKLARQAIENLDVLNKNGELSYVDSRRAIWERREVEALQATGIEKRERVAALEVYVKRMKQMAAAAEQLRREPRSPTSTSSIRTIACSKLRCG